MVEKGDDVPKPVGAPAAPPTDWIALVGMALSYLVLNVAINTFNKYTLGVYGFHFPLSVTLAHQVFSFAVLSAWLRGFDGDRERTYREHWEAQKVGLGVTGVMTALNLGFNNGSLVLVSLSANQLITASMPLFTTAFTLALEPDAFKPHLLQLLALPAICLGVMMVVHQEHSQVKANVLGLALVFLSVLANALRTALSSKLLDGSKKLDILAMQWITSPIAALALIPFAAYMEGTAVIAFVASNPVGGGAVLVLGSCLALVYNLFLFHMIQVLKGVTMNILGNVKVVIIITASHYLFGDVLDAYRVAGALVTFLGVGLYTAGNYRMGTPDGMAEQARLRRHYGTVMAVIFAATLVAALCFVYAPKAARAETPGDVASDAVAAMADAAGGADGGAGLIAAMDAMDAEYGGGGGGGGEVGLGGTRGVDPGFDDLFDEEPGEDIVVNHPGFVEARPVDPLEQAELFDED